MKVTSAKYLFLILNLFFLHPSVNGDKVYKDATVDINKCYNTEEYGFEEVQPGHGQEECKLFVMNYGYRCNRVKDGVFYTIWSATGEERVCEIILNDRGSPRKILELVFTDTSRKYFYKPFIFLPWEEFTPDFVAENP